MTLSPQRLAVLDDVRDHAPVRVNDIAERLGLHVNTVREHLDALGEKGLVDHTVEPARGRGRPAKVFRPTPTADPTLPSRDYAGLATALAGYLARTSADPEADARAAGKDWGRELAREALRDASGREDASVPDIEDPHRFMLDLLVRLGFEPADHGPALGVALRRCPLLEAARRYPTVVCQVHLGIVEGAFEEIGAPTGPGLDLLPFVEPGACRLFLPDPAFPAPPCRET
ncbi:helix-turn-helix domain-containing protein [Rhodococcus sp. CC-R104]|uniref:Helix-turn-helix domain-containing protein n=1 Tax=Rhodococcus chondri TaxID=3065941 RepID=A0ABU7JW93_9NOCA|nr:helix-turn-helix domain-containing protein [Rhodococcus sp. CC-R104]MEE2034291.1 helix-turn-helix domain-containing protein [Rhodococcus sp. CC-R104]